MKTKTLFLLVAALILATGQLDAQQYFGQNKPNYEKFDFKVYLSPEFEIYSYLKDPEVVQQFANDAEKWYKLHQSILADTIRGKNPIILYNDHADFQQTNAISGQIGTGTGGVTEALKNRVVLPLTMSNEQTHHVLGHELVHAFQYNMVIQGDSTNLQNLGNLPLWMVEGLAEYMSIGRTDSHTAMWMRDAVLNDDVPSLKDLNNYGKYFPYRYGQVFWSFLTGWKGDDIIRPFFIATARLGFERACQTVLGVSQKELSKLWEDSFRQHFGSFLGDKKERLVGKELIGEKNGGKLNIAPEISPNGRYVIFLSEKDVFTTDLYLADVRDGKILSKVASTQRDGHIDDFNYIESSGAWSPDSKRFAFVGVSKGDNILIIKEAESGKTVVETPIKGLPAFNNPAWSPDGKTILLTGLVEGQVDLFAYDLKSKKIRRITDTPYSEMHPAWSADGSKIVFSTDQLSYENGRNNGKYTFNLATMDPDGANLENIGIFPGADNLNPELDTAGNIVFLSNRDGFRNLYRYELSSGKVFQLTDLLTGVSGITQYAPAISIDRRRDKVLYTYFSDNSYRIFQARPEDFLNREVDPQAVDMAAAELIRINKKAPDYVNRQLAQIDQLANLPDSSFNTIKYKPKFKLDYLGGGTGIGVGTSNTFGTTTGVAGGVDMLFSDILGNNQLFSSLSLNGEITDLGGGVAYLNRNNRIQWGASLSHIPYRSFGFGNYGLDERDFGDGGTYQVVADTFYIQRIFQEQIGGFASYPFSTKLRVEASGALSFYGSRLDQYVNVYQAIPAGGGYYQPGAYLGQERDKVGKGDPFGLWNVGAALVGDNSSFGLTAPLTGHRFRLGFDQYGGEYNFTAATADFRIYKFFKPVGVAFRAMHYGRYGGNGDELYPLYIGSPWYVRGLGSNSAQDILTANGKDFNQLVGSKMLVANAELRIPFTGPEQLSLIKSGFLFSDLNFFIDGGAAFYEFDQLKGPIYKLDINGNPQTNPTTGEPLVLEPEAKPIFTAGVSLRVNLFGALVLEPYYAFPLLKETHGVFGLNIVPGW